MRKFYFLLANNLLATITNMTVWFAITFFLYLNTDSVVTTGVLSGIYLVVTALTGIWFGSLVDNFRKKNIMLISSFVSFVMFVIGLVMYKTFDPGIYKDVSNPLVWVFAITLLIGVVAGNIRGIALPTIVTILFDDDNRDKANGIVGSSFGMAFLLVSVISGILVGHSGMNLVLILAVIFTVLTMVHLYFIDIPEKKIVHAEVDVNGEPIKEDGEGKVDIKGTLKAIRDIPGLFSLIFFTTFNSFLSGVFMSLMDPYGLKMTQVEIWGFLWAFVSTAFIVSGIIIAKYGLGKNPVRTLFQANIVIWVVSCLFTIQPSLALLIVGVYIYMLIGPYIEASEHTVIQKLVPHERQGRVFGFAQSIEQAASPLTAFMIGPITQLIFIPFMTTGAGVELIGSWFGTGTARGIALVFTLTGIIGLVVTLIAMRSRFYTRLSKAYAK